MITKAALPKDDECDWKILAEIWLFRGALGRRNIRKGREAGKGRRKSDKKKEEKQLDTARGVPTFWYFLFPCKIIYALAHSWRFRYFGIRKPLNMHIYLIEFVCVRALSGEFEFTLSYDMRAISYSLKRHACKDILRLIIIIWHVCDPNDKYICKRVSVYGQQFWNIIRLIRFVRHRKICDSPQIYINVLSSQFVRQNIDANRQPCRHRRRSMRSGSGKMAIIQANRPKCCVVFGPTLLISSETQREADMHISTMSLDVVSASIDVTGASNSLKYKSVLLGRVLYICIFLAVITKLAL